MISSSKRSPKPSTVDMKSCRGKFCALSSKYALAALLMRSLKDIFNLFSSSSSSAFMSAMTAFMSGACVFSLTLATQLAGGCRVLSLQPLDLILNLSYGEKWH